MKKLAKSILTAFLLMNLALTVQMAVAMAEDVNELSGEAGESIIISPGLSPMERLQSIGIEEETGLNPFITGQHPEAPPDFAQPGVGTITSPVYFALDMFRYFISGVALIVIVIATIKLISSTEEEQATKAKSTFIMGVLGFIVIQMADVIVKKVFFGEQGEALEDIASVEIFGKEGISQIRGIIGLIEVFLGAGAVLVIVIRGYSLLTSWGEEEAMTNAKNHIIYAAIGLAVIGLSEIIIRGFVFPKEGTVLPDVKTGKEILVMITNYLAGFISIFAFATLFYGGYKYVVSAGSDEATEQGKKIILAAVIALVLAMGAFALVNTLITFEEGQPDSATVDLQS